MENQIQLTGQEPAGLPARIYAGGSPSRRADALGMTAETLLKAVGSAQRSRGGPAYVHHYASEAVRRYTTLTNGILDDATPHLDAYMLKSLAERNPILQAVFHTIISNIRSHFRKPKGDKGIGLRVLQEDTDKSLTAAAAREAKRIEDILFYGGVPGFNPDTGEPGVWDSHGEVHADDLDTAIVKLVRDSLTMDRAFLTVEGSRGPKNPVMFWKVEDGALARLVDRKQYQPQIRTGNGGTDDLTGKVKYVLLRPEFDFCVDREYAWNEGIFAVRNPRADLLSFGYGKSETEQCLMALVGILMVLQGNQDWFTKNHVPQGLITLFGRFNEDEVADFQHLLSSEVGYPGGSLWEVPVLTALPEAGAAANYTPFVDRSRMDMVSRTYLEACVTIACANFQIAPEEINWASFGGPDQALNEADPESVLKHSGQKGTLPKVLWVAGTLTKLVKLINPDFRATVQGLDAVYNPEFLLQAQLEQAQLANGATMNDLAAINDRPPVVDPLDEEVWRSVKERHDNRYYGTERERVQAMLDEYQKKGGRLGKYPDAPVGNPGALQIWFQEHMAEQQQAQEQMGAMAQGEQQNQFADQQAEKQGARDAMNQQAAGEQENQLAKDAEGDKAAAKNELRIPAGSPGSFGAVRKAIRVVRVTDPVTSQGVEK